MAVTITHASSHCAACFGAKPHVAHVDFGSVYEGPTLVHPDGSPQSIDDLVVCAGCIQEAARALALAENPVEGALRDLASAREDAVRWREYAEGLEHAHEMRPEPVRRGRGRPKVRAPRPVVKAT